MSRGQTLSYEGSVSNETFRIRLNNIADRIVIVDEPTGQKIAEGILTNTSEVVVNGNGGNDRFIIDYSNGNPIPADGIQVSGGSGIDSLAVEGTFGTWIHQHTNGSDGTLDVDGDGLSDIFYSGLEPVDMTGSTAGQLVFNLPGTDDHAEISLLGGDTNRIASVDVPATFESTDFLYPSGVLTIDGGPGNDSLTFLDAFTPGISLNLTSETVTVYGSMVNNGGSITTDQFYLNPSNDLTQVNLTLNQAGQLLHVSGDVQLGGSMNSASNFYGNVNHNAGLVDIGGDLRFGSGANEEGGSYNLNNGELRIAGSVVEPDPSVDAAQFHLNAGAVQIDGNINVQRFALGQSAVGDFAYDVPSGQRIETTGTMAIGSGGKGYLAISNANVEVMNQNVIVGEGMLGTGTVIVDGDRLWQVAEYLRIGGNGTGTVQIVTGEVNAGGHSLGQRGVRLAESASGVGTLIVGESGSLSMVNPLVVGTNGNFECGNRGVGHTIMNSGLIRQDSANIIVGQAVGSAGTFTLNGGRVEAAANLRIGNSGSGLVEQYGGEFSVGATLDVGNNTQAEGTYRLLGGMLGVTNSLVIGNVNEGTLMQSGGVLRCNGTIIAGNTSNSTGRIVVDGGEMSNFGQVLIGHAGEGQFELNDGDLETGTALIIGSANGGQGTFTMRGGNVYVGRRVNNNMIIGNVDTNITHGVANILAGTMEISAGIRLANSGADSSGELNIGDPGDQTGPLIQTGRGGAAANVETGDKGTGVVNFYSGRLEMGPGNFITGQQASSSATVNIGGGLHPAVLDLTGGDSISDWNTNLGQGFVNVTTNGQVLVGRNINLGTNTNDPYGLELTINGGEVLLGQVSNHVGAVSYRNGGAGDQINLVAGTLGANGGVFNFNDASATQFSWTGGTMKNFRTINQATLVQQGGILEIGEVSDPGLMIFNQGFSNVAGKVMIDIEGSAPEAEHDQLRVFVNLTLGGELEVRGSPTLTHGQEFMIVDNRSAEPVSGTFVGLPEGAKVSNYTISYTGGDGNDVVLRVLDPEAFQPVIQSSDVVRILFQGLPDTSYTIQYADNTIFPPYTWIDIGAVVSGTDGHFWIDHQPLTESELYRAESRP